MTVEKFAPPVQSSRRAQTLTFTAVTAAGLAAVGMLSHISPEEPGNYPTCPFLAISGLYCPGCGSLRAIHALTQGDAVTAVERNPLAVAFLPVVLAAWVLWGLRLVGLSTWTTSKIPARWIWGLLVVVLVFWVARNIPGWTWLSPL